MNYLEVIAKYYPNKTVVEAKGDRYEDLVWNTLDPTPNPTKAELDAKLIQATQDSLIPTVLMGTKALSTDRAYPFFTTASAATKNTYLKTYGGIATNLIGYPIPKNATIVTGTAQLQVPLPNSYFFRVRKSGSSANLATIALPAGSTTLTVPLDLDVAKDAALAVYVEGTENGAYPTLTLEIAWRL